MFDNDYIMNGTIEKGSVWKLDYKRSCDLVFGQVDLIN